MEGGSVAPGSASSFLIREMSALRTRSASSMSSRSSGRAEMGKDEERMDRSRLAQRSNRCRLTSLLRLHHLHRKSLPLVQSAQPGALDHGDVYEHVLSSILAGH